MIEISLAIALGILSGIVAGLLPGIPILLGFMLFLPLVPLDPVSLLIYGIVMNIGTQFFGSMAVLYFKVPGESSSYPVLMELDKFNTPEKIYKAISLTALGSLIATLLAGVLLWLALATGIFSKLYMPIFLKMTLFAFLLILSVTLEKKYISSFLVLLSSAVFAFYPDLSAESGGLLPIYYFNSMLALIIIFAMQLVWTPPLVLGEATASKKSSSALPGKTGLMLKYSLVGTALGLVPQLGATISSYSSYMWEKFRGRDEYHRVTASETANNSALVFSWLPLLLFGVPITATEILLIQHFNMLGFDFQFLKSQAVQLQILGSIIISAFIYYMLTAVANSQMYSLIGKIITKKYFAILIAAVSISMFFALNNYSLMFVMTHLVIFIPVSWLVYKLKLSMLPVVVGLLLIKDILFTAKQVSQIYF